MDTLIKRNKDIRLSRMLDNNLERTSKVKNRVD
jgi:hypothetical protein